MTAKFVEKRLNAQELFNIKKLCRNLIFYCRRKNDPSGLEIQKHFAFIKI